MNLQLKKWQIASLNLTKLETEREDDSKRCQLSVGHNFPENEKRMFIVGFKVNLHDYAYDLNVEMIFEFETDGDITIEFMNSAFPKVNAPAIAFPYLRAFLSNLTLQAGYQPVIIPSINFVKLANGK